MAIELSEVVPWGRSYLEYCQMFDLQSQQLELSMLGIGDGPASFNCQLTRRGGKIVSADPLYAYSTDQIRRRIDEVYENIMEQTRRNQSSFTWRAPLENVEALGELRMSAMREFLQDYLVGRREGRYVAASLPSLPFTDRQFQLAVCSHLLFLYTEQLGAEFHLASLLELCRVADEVRVFPLVQLDGSRSHLIDPALAALREMGRCTEIIVVPYEFQRGANQMLRIWQ
ncbi:MAG: SAM-dependent methyltransferase [Planctomycetales bacterium]|nr:SAM-dependent methyltransferase [Planctomycetales bacterium]